MPTKATIPARCPVCGVSYRVPAGAAGHRARCARCRTVFRVPHPESSPQPPARIGRRQPAEVPRHLPTEEDILAWLSEGQDEDGPIDREEMLDSLLDSGAAAVARDADAGASVATDPARRLGEPRNDTLARIGLDLREGR